jgi:hypothetical protein
MPRRSIARTLVPAVCALWALALSAVAPQAAGQRASARVPRHAALDTSLFTHSENCVACHNNLVTPAGEDVSIGSTWRSTMMANSARDPYWQASVRRETIDHPSRSADIQNECASCHMPMSQRISAAAGAAGNTVFAQLPIAGTDNSDLHRLAADSISCALCHQIAPDRLGTPESYNARFVVKPIPPGTPRIIYGPFAIDAGRQTIMRSVTGYVQAEAPHIRESSFCASCHTLITEAFGPSGEIVGRLPEQMNYQEWQHSDFEKERRTCQACHMPVVPGPVRIASVLGDDRDSLARHVFVGGNAFMVRMLNRFRVELGVAAQPFELEATTGAALRQLQQDTARLAVSEPQWSTVRRGRAEGDVRSEAGKTLGFDVEIRNLSGHKFPTGYPARRAWLHVTVTDESGRAVFESGALSPAGAIDGNDADVNPASFEPHYETITRPDQVQVYESILGDVRGVPTTGLVTATQYLKDNRLLPRGFDKATAEPDIAVHGEARADPDFGSEGDRVRYEIPLASEGPFTVRVELRYQPIAYRWAHNLESYDAAEPKRFVSYYTSMSSESSVVVARGQVRTR